MDFGTRLNLVLLEYTRSAYWLAYKQYKSLLAKHKFDPANEQLKTKIAEIVYPAVRAVANTKLNGRRNLQSGLITRYNQSDLDDLIQLGMMGVWKALHAPNLQRPGTKPRWDTLLQNAKNQMDRGGEENFRLTGDIPLNISNEIYKIYDGAFTTEPDYDLEQIEQNPSKQTEKELAQALRAITKSDLPPRIKKYYHGILTGKSNADIAKELGVSPAAVSSGIKNNIEKVRELLGDSYIAKNNLIS